MVRSSCIRSVAVALGFLTISACGSEVPAFIGGLTDVGVADGSGGDGTDGGVLPDAGDDAGPECATSSDCAGGEVCRDRVCREVCGDEDPCEGDLGICDPDSGLCVECLGDSDCPGGFRCTDNACVSIDICETGAERCQGADIEVCEGGQWVVSASCGAFDCVDVGDGPTCQELVCTPNERRCEGNTLRACNDDGTFESAVACADLPSCQGADFGCACEVDACVERVCRPGSQRCDGDNVVVCVGNGLEEVIADTCTGDESCQAGECLSDSCDIGARRCAGDTLLTCDPFGWMEEDCTDRGSFCDEDTATCQAWLCEPGERVCSASQRAIVECDERGTSSSRTDCDADEYCRAGACLPQVCEPDTQFCAEGDAYRCDSVGGSVELAERCTDAETCVDGACVGAGECGSNSDCPVPDASCSGDTLIQYSAGFGRCLGGACNFESVTTRTECTRFDQVCSSGPPARCVETGCAGDGDCPGGFCDGGLCVECLNGGDCGSDEYCLDGACTDCGCLPGQICNGAGECVGGGGDPDDCSSDAECQALAEGLGYTGTDAACSSGGECYIAGICGDASVVGPVSSDLFDPFGASCPAGMACQLVLFGLDDGRPFSACGPCEDDDDCREGESCVDGILGFSGPYCGSGGGGGGGFPFP